MEQPSPLIPGKKLDESIVRQSYDATVDACARLSSFAETGPSERLNYQINQRQIRFAIDDLIHMSISFRRLVQSTDLHSLAKNISAPQVSIMPSKNGPVSKIIDTNSLWRISNYIVHSSYLYIIHNEQQLLKFKLLTSIRMIMNNETFSIRPLCLVENDQGKNLNFHIGDFCFSIGKALDHISDHCADYQIFLETSD